MWGVGLGGPPPPPPNFRLMSIVAKRSSISTAEHLFLDMRADRQAYRHADRNTSHLSWWRSIAIHYTIHYTTPMSCVSQFLLKHSFSAGTPIPLRNTTPVLVYEYWENAKTKRPKLKARTVDNGWVSGSLKEAAVGALSAKSGHSRVFAHFGHTGRPLLFYIVNFPQRCHNIVRWCQYSVPLKMLTGCSQTIGLLLA